MGEYTIHFFNYSVLIYIFIDILCQEKIHQWKIFDKFNISWQVKIILDDNVTDYLTNSLDPERI